MADQDEKAANKSRAPVRQVAPNGVVLPVKGNEFSGKDYQKAVLALQAPLPPAKPTGGQ